MCSWAADALICAYWNTRLWCDRIGPCIWQTRASAFFMVRGENETRGGRRTFYHSSFPFPPSPIVVSGGRNDSTQHSTSSVRTDGWIGHHPSMLLNHAPVFLVSSTSSNSPIHFISLRNNSSRYRTPFHGKSLSYPLENLCTFPPATSPPPPRFLPLQ